MLMEITSAGLDGKVILQEFINPKDLYVSFIRVLYYKGDIYPKKVNISRHLMDIT